MATLKYWLWLTTRSGMQPVDALRILDHFGTPEKAYFADPAEYALVEKLSRQAAASLRDKSLNEANRILGDCDRLGIHILTIQDAEYPERLKNLYDPPSVLYVKGKSFRFDEEIAIGVVGARDPTPYGVEMAGRMGLELAQYGALVISGMAEGLDAAAVRGALKGGGNVVSVLGNGVDVRYPSINRYLYEDVAAVGALMSEYPPGTGPTKASFPQRNRILSGLCLGVVAVECRRKRSGTMVTARLALDQDRDLFAVPGNADAPMSEGTNYLIQRGAGLVTCGWDVVQEYADRFPGKVRKPGPIDAEVRTARLYSSRPLQTAKKEKVVDVSPKGAYSDLDPKAAGLTDDQIDLLSVLGEKTLLADELVELAQIPAKRVLSALTMLQVKCYIKEEAGKRFSSLVRLVKP